MNFRLHRPHTWLSTLLAFIALCLTGVTRASAQQAPHWEVFGGYQAIRQFTPCCGNTLGFTGTLAENTSRWFGGVVDIGSSTHTYKTGAHDQLITAMCGPQFTLRRSRYLQPFARALIGGADERLAVGAIRTTVASLAGGAGGGFDLRLNRGISFRARADYIRTAFSSQPQYYGQTSLGLNYRFGGITPSN